MNILIRPFSWLLGLLDILYYLMYLKPGRNDKRFYEGGYGDVDESMMLRKAVRGAPARIIATNFQDLIRDCDDGGQCGRHMYTYVLYTCVWGALSSCMRTHLYSYSCTAAAEMLTFAHECGHPRARTRLAKATSNHNCNLLLC
jgi:hypothetical protein